MAIDENPNRQKAATGYQGIARWMIYSAWLLLLLLLTLLFSQWLDRQNNPNSYLASLTDHDGATAVVLKRNRSGHYLAPGSLNGVEVNFLLDTGATFVAVPQAVAEAAGLSRRARSQSMTASGVVASWLTVIDEVQLGPIVMHDVRAAIIPTMPGNEVLLGMSFLQHLKLEQQGESLKLTLPVSPAVSSDPAN